MIPIRSRGGASPRFSKQAVAEAPATRVVTRPVPEHEAKDARGYQLEQLRRRYSPAETALEDGEVSLLFDLSPSDPDFPFPLDHLECELRVPVAYPKQAPRLQVKNKDIPRGFAINIEKGWDRLVQEKRGGTLLSLTYALDRNLESLLSEQKAETVKLTIFKDTRHLGGAPIGQPAEKPKQPDSNLPAAPRPYVPEESYTRDQIADAKARRSQELRQLEARMGRLPLYQKSSDGIVYTLPLEPKRRADLPAGLQPVQSVQLIIPLLYPLQSLRILLNGVESDDAEGLEDLFTQKADEQKERSLMSHMNYLAQNLHLLAKQAQKPAPMTAPISDQPNGADEEAKEAEHSSALDAGKGHIHVIPRPPEWTLDDDTDSSEVTSSDDEDDADGGAAVEAQDAVGFGVSIQTRELGIAISFPSIELYGIELLEVSVLNLSVKCDRCKTLHEITGLKDQLEKPGSCKKCAAPFTVRYRPEPVHQHSTRAGFIDAAGCTVADLLPSTFTPTCSTCSHPSSTAFLSVRGATTTNVCRACHARFTFALPEVKFLAYAPGLHRTALASTAGPRRKQEKHLGLRAGEPLPERGACAHYRRSFRWFRFSCCERVYPCDRCHDVGEEHVNEWASRMVCGWCSREQRYSVESCAFCGRSVIGRRGKGYWEGGKGTRDQRLMRRGDKRKYRRLGPAKKDD